MRPLEKFLTCMKNYPRKIHKNASVIRKNPPIIEVDKFKKLIVV